MLSGADLQEHGQKPNVLVRMTKGVKARQEDQSQSPGDREKNRPDGAGLVKNAFVRHQLAGMT